MNALDIRPMTTAMACPRCHTPLSETALGGARFSGCARCGGAWVDSAGCAAILEGTADAIVVLAEQLAQQATVGASPFASASCPVCQTELALGTVPPTGTVIQSCARHGTWFDRAALPAVAGARTHPPAAAAVTSWIAKQGESDPVAASIPSRIVAGTIDAALAFLSAAIPMKIGFELAVAGVLPQGLMGWVDVMLLVLACFGAFWIWQAAGLARNGQTIGKYLEGIRVVQTNGSPAGFWRAVFLRSMALPLAAAFVDAAATQLDDLPGLAALAAGAVVSLAVSLDPWLIVLPARRALHDYIAGTRVVVTDVNPKHKRASRVIFGTCVVFAVLGLVILLLSKC